MIFIGTVNVGNIVAPDLWKESPIVEKIVSNSTGSSTVYQCRRHKAFY